MYVRWRHQQITGVGGNWKDLQHRDGMESHTASLLRSRRDGDKVRQSVVAGLGYFKTRHGVLTERDADSFWQRAMIALDRLDINEQDREKAESDLSAVLEQFVTTTA